MSDPYASLIEHSGYLVYRKTKVDFGTPKERWTEAELKMIKPCIMHLVSGGNRAGFSKLDDKRIRQIEIRIAAAYVDLEQELGSSYFPCLETEWFAYRLSEERKTRAAATQANQTS